MPRTEPEWGTQGKDYTVDEALMKAGFGCFHWKLLFLTGSLFSAEAIETMLLTFLMPILKDLWDLESPWDSMIGIALFIGSFAGAIVFSKISDKFGRKKVIMLCAMILSLAGIVTALVTHIYAMLLCRFFSGLGISGAIISITLFQEFAPQNHRGTIFVYEMMFWFAGSIFSVLLAWVILPNMPEDTGWRLYVGLSAIPAWIVTIASAWIPESIRWYCTVGMFNEAEKKIQQILKDNGKEPITGRLIRAEIIAMRGKVTDIFVPRYRKTSFIMIINFMVSMMCYYFIVFVSVRLFVDSSLYLCEFITSLAELPGIGFGYLMDRIGRKSMMLGTWIVNTVGFSAIAYMWFYTSTDTIAIVIVVFIVRLLSWVCNMTAYLYFLEYYPTAIRTTALGLAFSMSRLTIGATVFLSEDVDIATGNILFGIFSMIALIGTLVLEDTTGKILENDVDRTDCRKPGTNVLVKGKPTQNYVTINSELNL